MRIVEELGRRDSGGKTLLTDEINKLKDKTAIHIYNFSSIVEKFLVYARQMGRSLLRDPGNYKILGAEENDALRNSDDLQEAIYRHFSTLLIDKYLNIIPEDPREMPGRKKDMTNIIGDALNRNIRANADFHFIIDEGVKESASNKILTYLKIRNDHPTMNNERFDIKLMTDTDARTGKTYYNEILIKYRDTKDEIHDIEEGGSNINIVPIGKPGSKKASSNPKEAVDKNKYNYLFGRYSGIYPQKIGPDAIKNKDIAKDMTAVIKSLDEGKPVFIIGYGASGAGKTSTLVYFKSATMTKGENGILIELCRQMQKKGYEKATVKTKEYYSSKYPIKLEQLDPNPTGGRGEIKMCTDHSKEEGVTVCETSKPLNFGWVEEEDDAGNMVGDFKLDAVNTPYEDVLHEYRWDEEAQKSQRSKDGTSIGSRGKNDRSLSGSATMGEIIVNLVDKDRLVKATTNNPQSSRSHTVVYIELKKPGGKTAYLFVGDFAGVENEFACKDINTIKKFVNIGFPAVEAASENATNILGLHLQETRKVPFYSYAQKAGAGSNPLVDKPTGPGGKCLPTDPCKFYKVDPVYGRVPTNDTYIWDPSKNNIGTIQLMDFNWLNTKTRAEGADGYMDQLYVKGWLDYLSSANTGYFHGLNPSAQRIAEEYLRNDKNFEDIPLKNIMEIMLYGIDGLDGLDGGSINIDKGNDGVYDDIWQRITKNRSVINRGNTYNDIQSILESGNIETEVPEVYKKLKERVIGDFYDGVPWVIENMDGTRWHEWIENMDWMPKSDRGTRHHEWSRDYDKLNYGPGGRGSSKNDAMTRRERVWYSNPWQPKGGARTRSGTEALTFWETPESITPGTGSIQLGVERGAPRPSGMNKGAGPMWERGSRQKLLDLLHNKEMNTYTNQGAIIPEFFHAELIALLNEINSNYILDERNIEPKVKDVLRRYDDDKEKDEAEKANEDDIIFSYVDMTGAKGVTELFKYLFFGKWTLTSKEEALDLLKSSGVIKEVRRSQILKLKDTDNPDQPKYMKHLKIKSDRSNRDSTLTIVKVCEEILNSIEARLKYGQAICENRLIEGKFINNSLSKIRKTLEKILISKNQDVIFTIPDNVSICSDYYKEICGETCFNGGSSGSLKTDDRSLIIFDIFEYLKEPNRLKSPGGGEYQEKDFYKDLLVSVFLVLNISPLANNPPPAPHINLTGLKIALAKLTSARGTTRKDVEKEINKVNDMIKYYNEEGGNNTGDITNKVDVEPFKWKGGAPNSEVSKFIQRVDNTNAVSAIGTLEFLDEISKFYTTKVICQVSNDMFENAEKMYGYTPYLKIIKDDYVEEGEYKLLADKKEKGITTITKDEGESSTAGRVVSLESSTGDSGASKSRAPPIERNELQSSGLQSSNLGKQAQSPSEADANEGTEEVDYVVPTPRVPLARRVAANVFGYDTPSAEQRSPEQRAEGSWGGLGNPEFYWGPMDGGRGRRGKRTSNKRRKRTLNKRRKRTIRKK